MLLNWLALVVSGRSDLADIRRHRTHADPKQIVSEVLHTPKVHFGVPSAQAVPTKMKALIACFNDRGPRGFIAESIGVGGCPDTRRVAGEFKTLLVTLLDDAQRVLAPECYETPSQREDVADVRRSHLRQMEEAAAGSVFGPAFDRQARNAVGRHCRVPDSGRCWHVPRRLPHEVEIDRLVCHRAPEPPLMSGHRPNNRRRHARAPDQTHDGIRAKK